MAKVSLKAELATEYELKELARSARSCAIGLESHKANSKIQPSAFAAAIR
jgi:hypothetical protein